MKNRKEIKKMQSVFCVMAYQVIEECREQFAKVENAAGYMPEMADCTGDSPEYMEMYNWGDR